MSKRLPGFFQTFPPSRLGFQKIIEIHRFAAISGAACACWTASREKTYTSGDGPGSTSSASMIGRETPIASRQRALIGGKLHTEATLLARRLHWLYEF